MNIENNVKVLETFLDKELYCLAKKLVGNFFTIDFIAKCEKEIPHPKYIMVRNSVMEDFTKKLFDDNII